MKSILLALITLIFLSGCQGNAPVITELELSGPSNPGLNDQAVFSLNEGDESYQLMWRIVDSNGKNQQQAILVADYLKLEIDVSKLNGIPPYKVEVVNEKLSLETSFEFSPIGVTPSPDKTETIVENEPEIETRKLNDGFVCNDLLVFEKIDELFEGELFIGRLAGLGGGRGIFTCNILVDNQAIIQMELRSQFDIESATYFFNDQERQYLLQVSDFEKKEESITETAFSYYSQSTEETRILFIDTDPEKPIVVKIKQLPNYSFGPEKLFEVARALEKII